MLLNNKGSFLYETIIGFLIVSVVFTHLMTSIVTLSLAREVAKEDYHMRQILVSEILLYEQGRIETNKGEFHFIIRHDLMCIVYQSIMKKEKEYCLRYE